MEFMVVFKRCIKVKERGKDDFDESDSRNEASLESAP